MSFGVQTFPARHTAVWSLFFEFYLLLFSPALHGVSALRCWIKYFALADHGCMNPWILHGLAVAENVRREPIRKIIRTQEEQRYRRQTPLVAARAARGGGHLTFPFSIVKRPGPSAVVRCGPQWPCRSCAPMFPLTPSCHARWLRALHTSATHSYCPLYVMNHRRLVPTPTSASHRRQACRIAISNYRRRPWLDKSVGGKSKIGHAPA